MRVSKQEPNGPGCGTCFNARATFQLRSGDVERPIRAPGLSRHAEVAARSHANQRFYGKPRKPSETFGECRALRGRAGTRLECSIASFEREFQANLVFLSDRAQLRLVAAREIGEYRPLALRCASVELPRGVGCG